MIPPAPQKALPTPELASTFEFGCDESSATSSMNRANLPKPGAKSGPQLPAQRILTSGFDAAILPAASGELS